jgi:ubiquinone/menaquinone biosynthesis C-methylase UbiE
MNERERSWMRERYSARLAEFGDDIRTLGSGTEERRRLRFAVLQAAGIEPGMRVVDVGCGFGDFYGYLRGQDIEVDYVGLDINADLLEIASSKYPSARFALADAEVDPIPAADVIVASGTFNLALREGDNYDYVGRIFERAHAQAQVAVAMDFQSSDVDFRVPEMYYYEPERVFRLAKRLTKRVTLRHDYPLFEFCIYFFPDFRGWRSGQPAGLH